MQVFLDHIYWYKLLLSHVLTQEQGFPFLLAKRCSRSRSDSRLRPSKKSAPAPQHCLRLCPNIRAVTCTTGTVQ